jgi:hypothetical protein
MALAAPKRNRTARLATGMHVVRTAPQHHVGEQHDGGQVGQEMAQDNLCSLSHLFSPIINT